MQPAQSELAGANRKNGGDRGGHRGRRALRRESTDARARNEQQEHAQQRERDSRRRFEEHVPAPHQIERRQQVTVEPALREDDREHDESDAGQCDEPSAIARRADKLDGARSVTERNQYGHSAKTMLDVEAADVCWHPIGAVGSTASTSAQVGVERSRSACP